MAIGEATTSLLFKEVCSGNVDLMPGLRCCVISMEKSGEVKLSLMIWSVASYVFQLNGVNHLITIDRVKGAMHDNMFNVLCIFSKVTHMSVNNIKLVKMCIKLIMPCFFSTNHLSCTKTLVPIYIFRAITFFGWCRHLFKKNGVFAPK